MTPPKTTHHSSKYLFNHKPSSMRHIVFAIHKWCIWSGLTICPWRHTHMTYRSPINIVSCDILAMRSAPPPPFDHAGVLRTAAGSLRPEVGRDASPGPAHQRSGRPSFITNRAPQPSWYVLATYSPLESQVLAKRTRANSDRDSFALH